MSKEKKSRKSRRMKPLTEAQLLAIELKEGVVDSIPLNSPPPRTLVNYTIRQMKLTSVADDVRETTLRFPGEEPDVKHEEIDFTPVAISKKEKLLMRDAVHLRHSAEVPRIPTTTVGLSKKEYQIQSGLRPSATPAGEKFAFRDRNNVWPPAITTEDAIAAQKRFEFIVSSITQKFESLLSSYTSSDTGNKTAARLCLGVLEEAIGTVVSTYRNQNLTSTEKEKAVAMFQMLLSEAELGDKSPPAVFRGMDGVVIQEVDLTPVHATEEQQQMLQQLRKDEPIRLQPTRNMGYHLRFA